MAAATAAVAHSARLPIENAFAVAISTVDHDEKSLLATATLPAADFSMAKVST
jgi:hypothetical protein